MADLPTRADFFAIGAAEVLRLSAARPASQRISREAIFTPGSDINVQLGAQAAMAEEVVRQTAMRQALQYLDGASGDALDRLVTDRFSPDLVRKGATPALATLQLTRTTGSLTAGSLPVGTIFVSTGGIEFETTAVVVVPLSSNGPISAPVRARVSGIAGNVAKSTITQFKVPPFDPNLRVTNAEPAAGGDDDETDASYRARARAFFLNARRGTIGAIEQGALAVAGVRQATAVEDVDSLGQPTGYVFLYIADANGQANAALAALVRQSLLEFRAAGIVVTVIGATPTFVPIVLRLRFNTNVDTTAAFAQVQTAIVAAVNALAPSQTLSVSLIFSAARTVPGVIVLGDAIVAPVGDVVPAGGQIIRTRVDLITEAPP